MWSVASLFYVAQCLQTDVGRLCSTTCTVGGKQIKDWTRCVRRNEHFCGCFAIRDAKRLRCPSRRRGVHNNIPLVRILRGTSRVYHTPPIVPSPLDIDIVY